MQQVLVIEDSKFFLRTLLNALRNQFPQLRFVGVADWADAQAAMEKTVFDLIISDLTLPDSDGHHVEALVEKGERVIVLTAHADADSRKRFNQLNIIDYILKDYSFEYLFSLINRLINNVGKRVLMVEDSKTMRLRMRRLLSLMNLSVDEVTDGQQALDQLEDQAYDLVLLDYEMPNLDGIQTLQAIRRRHSKLRLPVIAISGTGQQETVVLFLKAGANDFLNKPFSREEFLVRVNNQLDMLDAARRIEQLAIVDPLTGLYNRNFLYEILPQEISESHRYEKPLSLIILDVDHFKQFNDTWGHDVGDLVLKHVASLLKDTLRETDIPFRYGGEEFIIVLPEAHVENAVRVAEKVRNVVADTPLVLEDQPEPLRVTISLGVAELKRDDTLDTLIKQADQALYAAKRGGRNRTEVAH